MTRFPRGNVAPSQSSLLTLTLRAAIADANGRSTTPSSAKGGPSRVRTGRLVGVTVDAIHRGRVWQPSALSTLEIGVAEDARLRGNLNFGEFSYPKSKT